MCLITPPFFSFLHFSFTRKNFCFLYLSPQLIHLLFISFFSSHFKQIFLPCCRWFWRRGENLSLTFVKKSPRREKSIHKKKSPTHGNFNLIKSRTELNFFFLLHHRKIKLFFLLLPSTLFSLRDYSVNRLSCSVKMFQLLEVETQKSSTF